MPATAQLQIPPLRDNATKAVMAEHSHSRQQLNAAMPYTKKYNDP